MGLAIPSLMFPSTRAVEMMIGNGACLLLKRGVSLMDDQSVAAPGPDVTAVDGRVSLTKW